MIRILGTIFAGLLGLAFGSFLNVCLSRWPAGESVVRPRSHCRNCDHTLAWWENVPLVSWLALRGRCRKCGTPISWRYPLVELAVALLWAEAAWKWMPWLLDPNQQMPPVSSYSAATAVAAEMILGWLLIALAALDAEHLWLPNFLTIPGMALGFASEVLRISLNSGPVLSYYGALGEQRRFISRFVFHRILAILAAAALILLIRWLYKLIRRREGMGLGDAKLMALLAAWLGLPGALLAFGLGAILGSVVALVLLAVPAARRGSGSWGGVKLPFGTFLCVGGIVSALWGQPMINAYLRWAGF
jgi:leader peptidase (prepilin peptidase)/N-methyltransferase